MNALDEKGIDWGEIIFLVVIVYGPMVPVLFISGFWPWLVTVVLETVAFAGMAWCWGAALVSGGR